MRFRMPPRRVTSYWMLGWLVVGTGILAAVGGLALRQQFDEAFYSAAFAGLIMLFVGLHDLSRQERDRSRPPDWSWPPGADESKG